MQVSLTQPQSFIMIDPARFKVIRCGRRFGKTYLAVTKLIYEALKVKGDYWFVSPYYRQSKEIAWRLLDSLVPKGTIKSRNESDLSIEFKNGSIIKLKGADNPEALKGVGLRGCILDEYAFMKPYVWQEIVRPMLFDSGGWCWFISTPYGYNHFYELYEWVKNFENTNPDQWSRFHFTTYDNPHINPAEINESRISMSPERFSQEIMAEFTKKSGAVFPLFSRKIHVKPRRNPDKQASIFGSIDFGFAIGHPTAVLWHEVTADGVYTFDGFTAERMNIEKISEMMRAQTNGLVIRGVFCDTARPDLIDVISKINFPIMDGVIKDVELGIEKVTAAMNVDPLTNRPRWTISEHLSDAIRQIEGYEWMEVRGEDGMFKNKPKKEDDDNVDSLRYFFASYNAPSTTFDKALKRVQQRALEGIW